MIGRACQRVVEALQRVVVAPLRLEHRAAIVEYLGLARRLRDGALARRGGGRILPWHSLYRCPLPHGHGALRDTGGGSSAAIPPRYCGVRLSAFASFPIASYSASM